MVSKGILHPICICITKISSKIILSFYIFKILEERWQNMYFISSVIEYIIMVVSQNMPIYTYSLTLAHNGIFIKLYLKAPALECIFRDLRS